MEMHELLTRLDRMEEAKKAAFQTAGDAAKRYETACSELFNQLEAWAKPLEGYVVIERSPISIVVENFGTVVISAISFSYGKRTLLFRPLYISGTGSSRIDIVGLPLAPNAFAVQANTGWALGVALPNRFHNGRNEKLTENLFTKLLSDALVEG